MNISIGHSRMIGTALSKQFDELLFAVCRASHVLIRTYLVAAFAVLLVIELSSAQDITGVTQLDTIYASTSKTTSLIFPERISIYDIGSEEFGGIKESNLLLLKAAHETAAPTSLIIKYGDSIYHGTLAYSDSPPNLFIDFSKFQKSIPQLPNGNRMAADDSLRTLAIKVSEKRLAFMLSDPKSYYKNNAVKDPKERIALTLSDLRTDESSVYLKLLLINESKLPYQVDFVEFIYQNPIEQKDLKGAYDKKNVYQSASNNVDTINGKDQRFIGYVIPRYTLGRKGELVIIVRERNGSRAITLPIPFNLILEAKPINK